MAQQSQDLMASYQSEVPYPVMKGPMTQKGLDKFAHEEMEDEYCALPFNHDPEYAVSLL